MSIFGPTDTRNYKRLAKDIYDAEVRFASAFCDIYAFTHNSTKFAVMEASRPYGALLYLYGTNLAYNILKEKGCTGEKSILLYYFAHVHKKPTSAFGDALNEDPSTFRDKSLEAISNAIYNGLFSDKESAKMIDQFFDQVEATVNKWSRDEF